jgi:hypothetical protein
MSEFMSLVVTRIVKLFLNTKFKHMTTIQVTTAELYFSNIRMWHREGDNF